MVWNVCLGHVALARPLACTRNTRTLTHLPMIMIFHVSFESHTAVLTESNVNTPAALCSRMPSMFSKSRLKVVWNASSAWPVIMACSHAACNNGCGVVCAVLGVGKAGQRSCRAPRLSGQPSSSAHMRPAQKRKGLSGLGCAVGA
eukprot:366539-Chlamydomonas_euryale.AAC.7